MVTYMISTDIVMKNAKENAANRASSLANKVEAIMSRFTISTKHLAIFAEGNSYSLKCLKEFNKQLIQNSKEAYGAAVAYEPYSVDSTKKYYSTYFYKNMGETLEGDLNPESYNYFNWDWYKEPKRLGKPQWIGPYFDKGGGNVLMATYSYPFYRYADGKKTFWGVATHDMALGWIKDLFSSLKIYKSGYAFLLTKSGAIIAHPDTSLSVGNSIFKLAEKLHDTCLYNIGVRMTNNETDFIPYYSNVSKIDAFLYFKPLESTGWSFGMVFPKKEVIADIKYLSQIEIILGISGAIILAVLIFFISRSLSRTVKTATNAAELIAEGNISSAERLTVDFLKEIKFTHPEKKIKSEPLRLFLAFQKMSRNLNSLIGQVQSSGISISSSATEIAASAHQLEATVAEQAASTKQVSITTKEIAASSKEFVKRIHNVDANVTNAAEMADAGRQGLDNLSEVMNRLISAAGGISSKLSIINENANRISAVITTIDKISDQTNLLSLNAAIEAEKAGDYGKGFAVVAREISRLSDQTSIAAADIETMVKEMQASVSYGVMEMDKFGNEVRNGSEEANVINKQLNEIIELVKQLKPEFESVEGGMLGQAEGAEQINESIFQLSEAAEQTKDSLTEFKNVTTQLNDAVMNLKREISKFNISKRT